MDNNNSYGNPFRDPSSQSPLTPGSDLTTNDCFQNNHPAYLLLLNRWKNHTVKQSHLDNQRDTIYLERISALQRISNEQSNQIDKLKMTLVEKESEILELRRKFPYSTTSTTTTPSSIFSNNNVPPTDMLSPVIPGIVAPPHSQPEGDSEPASSTPHQSYISLSKNFGAVSAIHLNSVQSTESLSEPQGQCHGFCRGEQISSITHHGGPMEVLTKSGTNTNSVGSTPSPVLSNVTNFSTEFRSLNIDPSSKTKPPLQLIDKRITNVTDPSCCSPELFSSPATTYFSEESDPQKTRVASAPPPKKSPTSTSCEYSTEEESFQSILNKTTASFLSTYPRNTLTWQDYKSIKKDEPKKLPPTLPKGPKPTKKYAVRLYDDTDANFKIVRIQIEATKRRPSFYKNFVAKVRKEATIPGGRKLYQIEYYKRKREKINGCVTDVFIAGAVRKDYICDQGDVVEDLPKPTKERRDKFRFDFNFEPYKIPENE